MRVSQGGYINIPCLFLVAATLLLGMVTHFYVLLTTPVSYADNSQIVDIQPGWSIGYTSRALVKKGLIPSAKVFTLAAMAKGAKIKAGEYRLSSNVTPWQILDVLQQGKTHLYKVTIPEGYSIRQIAVLLEDNNITSKRDFFEAANNPLLTSKLLGKDIKSLEGYLFPDTYLFARGTSPEIIIRTMLDRFKQSFNKNRRDQAAKLGFSCHQIVTLASLIEKETADDSERALIAAVYHNRLKKNIRLQCDPTVIYALEQLEQFDGDIKFKDLKIDSPYNTYRYKGLPPGPIANPGEASLMAALNPEDSDYIYFVSRNDGTHQFSTTLKKHNQAVYRYQKIKRNRKNRKTSKEN